MEKAEIIIDVAAYEKVIPHHSVVELVRPGVKEQISLGKADRLVLERVGEQGTRKTWTLHVYYF